MHRENYVCFECRTVRKGCGSCDCHTPLIYMGHKWRFPKKRDKKGWERMKQLVIQNAYHKQQIEACDSTFLVGK